MRFRKPIRYLTAFVGMAAMASLAAVPLAGISAGTVTAPQTAQLTSRMVPAVKMIGRPLIFKTTGPDKHGLFSCQAAQSATNPVPCYAPAQIRKAYDIRSNLTGAGETIVIIDAFGDPLLLNDLALFDATFGLPTPTVNVICPDSRGCPTFDPTNPDEVELGGRDLARRPMVPCHRAGRDHRPGSCLQRRGRRHPDRAALRGH